MNSNITNKDVQEFLDDYIARSETTILEEGKEKDEIIEIAKARGINLIGNKDLAGFKTIYTFADKANSNKARLPKKALLKALPSMIGKPVDIDHNRRYVIGAYIDYRYIVKTDKVIAYGVFYKSNFAEEWGEAQELFKAGKLATSYEIWCPKSKRKMLKDGTYELQEQEIAGGAILFKTTPAFKDAKVLELAKENLSKRNDELIYASEHKEEDVIIENSDIQIETKPVQPQQTVAPAPVVPIVPAKIKCTNCQHDMLKPTGSITEFKCPECMAVLDLEGKMIYPPQVIDFTIACLGCSSRNWRLLEAKEEQLRVKCLSCSKSYALTIKKDKDMKDIGKLHFLRVGGTSCKQCGKYLSYSGSSHQSKYSLKCNKCGLTFLHDINHEYTKQISSIEEIKPVTANNAGEPVIAKGEEMAQIEKAEVKAESISSESVPVITPVEATVIAKTEEISTPEITVATENAISASPVEPIVSEKSEEPVVAKEVVVEETKDETKVVTESIVEPVTASSGETVTVPVTETATAVAEEVVTAEKTETIVTDEILVEANKAEIEAIAEVKVEEAKKTVEEPKKEETEKEKKLRMKKEALLTRYHSTVKRLAKKVKLAKANNKKELIKASEEIEFYKANSVTISERRLELGSYAKDLSDREIVDDNKFTDVKLVKANKEIEETAEIAGTKEKGADYYTKKRQEIDDKAFGRTKRQR